MDGTHPGVSLEDFHHAMAILGLDKRSQGLDLISVEVKEGKIIAHYAVALQVSAASQPPDVDRLSPVAQEWTSMVPVTPTPGKEPR
jgi:hypothetical protein